MKSTMKIDSEKLQVLAKTIRMLSADGVEKANSGHPGMPMGTADMAAVLWSYFLRFNPEQPDWIGRDRFVLSAGHGSMLLYSLLHLFGFDLPLDQLKEFRQLGSKTPGHPEFGITAGVETTTGPLGQGFGNGIGFAISEKLLQERYGYELFSGTVYGIVSDGDLMEGIASEAASLAGHLKLGNVVYLYDDNEISIGGSTDICFTEDVAKRFESYGWHVQSIDGHNMDEVAVALSAAKDHADRPSLICARTTIGLGSPHKANTSEVHGAPLGAEELALTKQALGWPTDKQFEVPEQVRTFCADRIAENKTAYAEWQGRFDTWSKSSPEKAVLLRAQLSRSLPSDLQVKLCEAFADGKKDATRSLSGKAIQVLAERVPCFLGGSADLEPSTKTLIKDSTDIQPGEFAGRNLRFGVREHAMGAVVNGLAYTRAWIPFSATFLVFSDYMRPAIRLAALSHLQSLFIFTHDSFWVGEDGPTHQPIEHIMALRVIPNLYVFRPADGLETGMSYFAAVSKRDAPSTLLFTRQGVPALERPADFTPEMILRGGYVVSGKEHTDVVIVATGSEVWVAVEAARQLAAAGTPARVVSMPCVELFFEQDANYRDSVIPPTAKKISVEAGVSMGWERVVGSDGLIIAKDDYGASGPGEQLAEEFGFVPDTVRARIAAWL